jgi:hypothetical protein
MNASSQTAAQPARRGGLSRCLSGALLAALLLPLQALASQTQRVDNFVLLDHTGKAQELYYGNHKAIALMVHGNGCPIVRNAITDFKALRDEFEPKGVRFAMLNANLQDERASIAAEAREWGIDMPILDDTTQLIGEALKLVRTGEVLIIEPGTWEVVYRGPLDNRLDYERQKKQASERYAKDALTAVLAGRKVSQAERDAVGCLINFPARKANHAAISYTDTIAPLLQEKCAVCHRPGGIGPWAMTSYTMVQGFAPMIREVVRTRRMPPWHADPQIGHWKGDKSLSIEETQTLIHWIEAGAPRGEGKDPLLAVARPSDEWPLGAPDLVLEVPAFEVPAAGTVDYQFPVLQNPLDDGVWVEAATVIPGDRNVVHHVLVGAADGPRDSSKPRRGGESVFDNYIIGYAPGNESASMPEGTGVYIPKGADFLLQMHYTPYGKAAVDKTRVGLYFAKEQPENFLRHQVVLDPTIRIPPNVAEHEEVAYHEFDKDALLHFIVPHAHYRGRASSFELAYPDGRTEVLLSVPNYDFNWQRTYEFETPKLMPAGSRLLHRTVYDNSAANPGNPDPERTVPWGLQSWDEMLYGAFSYSWVDETAKQPIHDSQLSEAYQMVGFMDRDMDGKLSWKELPKQLQKRLVQGFKHVDANGDGGLDAKEFVQMQRRGQQQTGQRTPDAPATEAGSPPSGTAAGGR